MRKYRLYIDESGDHTYKQSECLSKRYFGVTGILIKKAYYDSTAQPALENLKRNYLTYDPDKPPILVRSKIIRKKGEFGVLSDQALNSKWGESILDYFTTLQPHAQVFTVVMDKKKHLEKYPVETFDPYVYSLEVLLWRVRGYLNPHGGKADVIAESRTKNQNEQIMNAYQKLKEKGSRYGNAQEYREAFPDNLEIWKKDYNIAGLQIADLLAAGQKLEILMKKNCPLSHPPSDYTRRLNKVVSVMVNPYGQYLLE